MNLWDLQGTPAQRAIASAGLARCDFPWNLLHPGLRAAVGRDTIPVEWADLSRWATPIRLLGIDTPELFTGTDRERGAAAKAFTATWFTLHDHGESWPVLVRTDKDRQSFNRYVGTITCWQGHDLRAALTDAGFA